MKNRNHWSCCKIQMHLTHDIIPCSSCTHPWSSLLPNALTHDRLFFNLTHITKMEEKSKLYNKTNKQNLELPNPRTSSCFRAMSLGASELESLHWFRWVLWDPDDASSRGRWNLSAISSSFLRRILAPIQDQLAHPIVHPQRWRFQIWWRSLPCPWCLWSPVFFVFFFCFCQGSSWAHEGPKCKNHNHYCTPEEGNQEPKKHRECFCFFIVFPCSCSCVVAVMGCLLTFPMRTSLVWGP